MEHWKGDSRGQHVSLHFVIQSGFIEMEHVKCGKCVFCVVHGRNVLPGCVKGDHHLDSLHLHPELLDQPNAGTFCTFRKTNNMIKNGMPYPLSLSSVCRAPTSVGLSISFGRWAEFAFHSMWHLALIDDSLPRHSGSLFTLLASPVYFTICTCITCSTTTATQVHSNDTHNNS